MRKKGQIEIEEPLSLRAQLMSQQAGMMKRTMMDSTLDLDSHPDPALPLDYPPLPLDAATIQQHYSSL